MLGNVRFASRARERRAGYGERGSTRSALLIGGAVVIALGIAATAGWIAATGASSPSQSRPTAKARTADVTASSLPSIPEPSPSPTTTTAAAPPPTAAPVPTAPSIPLPPPPTAHVCPTGGLVATVTSVSSNQDPSPGFNMPGFWHFAAHGTVTNTANASILPGLVDVTFQGANYSGTDIPQTMNATLPFVPLAPGESINWDTVDMISDTAPTGATAQPNLWIWADPTDRASC